MFSFQIYHNSYMNSIYYYYYYSHLEIASNNSKWMCIFTFNSYLLIYSKGALCWSTSTIQSTWLDSTPFEKCALAHCTHGSFVCGLVLVLISEKKNQQQIPIMPMETKHSCAIFIQYARTLHSIEMSVDLWFTYFNSWIIYNAIYFQNKNIFSMVLTFLAEHIDNVTQK